MAAEMRVTAAMFVELMALAAVLVQAAPIPVKAPPAELGVASRTGSPTLRVGVGTAGTGEIGGATGIGGHFVPNWR
jgi:hypothetical protein